MIWPYVILGCLGVCFVVVLTLYVARTMRAQASREASEPQSIQQVPRRARRQLSQGVGRQGQNRNSREMVLKEQAERERLANDRVTEIGTP